MNGKSINFKNNFTYVEKVVLTTILEEATVLDFGNVIEGAH